MTDPRLDAALERAAELVAGYVSDAPSWADEQYLATLAGWAEAIQALATHLPHPKMTLRCLACEAIATFITAMLGEEGDDD